jgi:hypothetical protein
VKKNNRRRKKSHDGDNAIVLDSGSVTEVADFRGYPGSRHTTLALSLSSARVINLANMYRAYAQAPDLVRVGSVL